MEERRNGARLLCAELVEVSWEDDSHRIQRRVANLEDISLSGVCLHIEKPILEGTEIVVSLGTSSSPSVLDQSSKP